jgi:type IV pilus assembly protein PilV
MRKSNIPAPKTTQEGVVLLESMIAILIFSFAVLGIIGLQAAMVKNTADSKFRAEASHIAQERIGAMWANPEEAQVLLLIETNTPIDSLLPNGTRSVAAVPGMPNQYKVTVTWQQPGDNDQHQYVTLATISGG